MCKNCSYKSFKISLLQFENGMKINKICADKYYDKVQNIVVANICTR